MRFQWFMACCLLAACAPQEKRDLTLTEEERFSIARSFVSDFPGWETQWVCLGKSLPQSNEVFAIALQKQASSGSQRVNFGSVAMSRRDNVSAQIQTQIVQPGAGGSGAKEATEEIYHALEDLALSAVKGEPFVTYFRGKNLVKFHYQKLNGEPLEIDCSARRILNLPSSNKRKVVKGAATF